MDAGAPHELRLWRGLPDTWFRTLAETTATAVVVYDGERFLYANRAAEEITGYSAAELAAMGPPALVHPQERAAVSSRLATRLRGDLPPERFETRLVHKCGEYRWAELTACRIEVDGRPAILTSAQDVSDRRRAEIALQEEKERAQTTLASIGDGVLRTDASGRVEYLNPVAERLIGCRLAEALGRPVGEVYQAVDESTGKPLDDLLTLCLAQKRTVERPGGALLVRGEGRESVVQDAASPIFDRDGALSGAVLVAKDVTRLRGMERQVSYLATHDPLTGLPNRRELEQRLASLLETTVPGSSHALCYLDLDEFKLVNDTCGHLAGDEMLRQIATLLGRSVPPRATLARLGGDEFALLLPDTPLARARSTAEALRTAVEGFRFLWDEQIFDLKASLGLVPIDGRGDSLSQVLAAADAACYVAKEGGRNRVHEYQPDDRALAARHGQMQWIHRIHKAFDERRFCLYRQRIQRLAAGNRHAAGNGDGGSAGATLSEIFIRMRTADGEIVAPGSFIPAAERYHLIPQIDRWVASTAFRILAERGGEDVFTINVSGQSLGDPSFLADVAAELESSGLDPRRLCFEITETAAIAHLAQAHRFLAALRAVGCRFVLDDFGSGLSSFAYLRDLPVDFLKISGQFVHGIESDGVQRAMVGSIRQVGDLMRIATIAEGVETAATCQALAELGVGWAQGYWIERPTPL